MVEEIFAAALGHEPDPPALDLATLSRFMVAVVDGLIIQYQVHHDGAAARAGLDMAIQAATMMTGLAE